MSEPDSTPAKLPSPTPRGAPAGHWAGRAGRAALRGLMAIAGGVLALLLGVAICAAIGLAVAYPKIPELSALTDYRPKLPLRVFSSDGVMLGEYGEERRQFVPIGQIPKVMRDAVLAIEDARFYHHGGVDYLGVIRAGLANVGEALYLISRLDPQNQPLFGLNPETAHSRIAGLDYIWDIELCLEAGKLFHIHLNSQDGQRYDQDLPFGYTEPLKDLALLVVLQDAGYDGIVSFDVKAPRVDDPAHITDILTVSAQNLVWLWQRALQVDRQKVAGFRADNRLTALSGYLAQCLYGPGQVQV